MTSRVDPSSPQPTADAVLARTRQLLDDTPYVVLATTGGSEVSARQVQPLAIDADLMVWVGTSPRSRKVDELSANPTATLVAEDFGRFTYASIVCDAEVVDDAEARDAHWIEELRPFFPAGPGGDDFVLVRLEPRRIELLDFAAGITPDPYGLVPAALVRQGDAWVEATHPRRSSPSAQPAEVAGPDLPEGDRTP